MKNVVAVIRPHTLEDVMDALFELGFVGMTVTEVRGCGREKYHSFFSQTYPHPFPKVEISMTVSDNDVCRVVQTILAAARTGTEGDGRVTVLPVEQFWNIRTQEDEAAVQAR